MPQKFLDFETFNLYVIKIHDEVTDGRLAGYRFHEEEMLLIQLWNETGIMEPLNFEMDKH